MMLHKKNFDVEKNLARLDSHMFGIDLHWMPHCHGSIEVAKILKRLHPHVPVSFGGLSSSIFHEDLIKYDCIDYVFRGDSTEEPMRMLIERVARAAKTHTPVGDLSDIPNLTWKDASGLEADERFVQHKQRRLVHECADEHELLAHAVRVRGHKVAQCGGEAQAIGTLPNAGLAHVGRHLEDVGEVVQVLDAVRNS